MILHENSAEVKRISPWDTRATTYRNRKRAGGPLDERLVVEVYRFHEQCFQSQKRQGQMALPHTDAVTNRLLL